MKRLRNTDPLELAGYCFLIAGILGFCLILAMILETSAAPIP